MIGRIDRRGCRTPRFRTPRRYSIHLRSLKGWQGDNGIRTVSWLGRARAEEVRKRSLAIWIKVHEKVIPEMLVDLAVSFSASQPIDGALDAAFACGAEVLGSSYSSGRMSIPHESKMRR